MELEESIQSIHSSSLDSLNKSDLVDSFNTSKETDPGYNELTVESDKGSKNAYYKSETTGKDFKEIKIFSKIFNKPENQPLLRQVTMQSDKHNNKSNNSDP